MSNRLAHRPAAAVLLLALATTPHHARAQTFTPLGPIEPGATSTARALSRDGSTVVGLGYINGLQQPFRWNRTDGMLRLPSGPVAYASGVSGDGQVVVGLSGPTSGYRPSFRWTATTGTQNTGTLAGGTHAYLEACNTDGSMITGVSYAAAFPNGRAVLWTPAAGMLPLAMPLGDTFTAAPGITPDGSITVGSSGSYAVAPPTSRAVRWDSSGVPEDLGVLPNVSHSSAAAVSADGEIIVGASGNFYDPNGNASIHAFRWTRAAGMQELHLPSRYSRAYAISGDGSVVAGTAAFRTGPAAFLWTPQIGLVNLNHYLPLLGSNLGILNLQSTVGVSADGRTIAGTGQRSDTFRDEAWIATLPETLPPCLTLGPVQITPGCPREHATLSISAAISTPYTYTWQVRTAAGEWIDIAGTVAVGCTSGSGGTISQAAPRDPASPTQSLLIRPCGGLSSYTFRALVYTDCTAKVSDEATYTICRADYDCDSNVSVLDIFAYLNDWFRGAQATDFDAIGPAMLSNLMAFISDWFTGC